MIAIENWPNDPEEQSGCLTRAPLIENNALTARVQTVLDAVRQEGDDALRRLTRQFDGVSLEAFRVPEKEAQAALDTLPSDLRVAMKRAKANIEAFHTAQKPQSTRVETQSGVVCEMQWRAIDPVGLYVPGGTAPLFSSVLMMAIPALVAGCRKIVLCSPPQKDGRINAATLAAAKLCGIEEVYTLGGAQAIAAMAYGTTQIPKVVKICGPGNAYVTKAKQLVAQDPNGAAIDMPAGPSEVMIIASPACRADWIAADMLAQAEHDGAAQAILLTTDIGFATRVATEIETQSARLSRSAIIAQSLRNSRILLVASQEEAVTVANRYAPEHLILPDTNADKIAAQIETAGSVFLGPATPETAGDYASGTNHVLPTYGAARAYSGLSVFSFLRSMTLQKLTAAGLDDLGPTLVTMARAEGLDAHAAAVTCRLVNGGNE